MIKRDRSIAEAQFAPDQWIYGFTVVAVGRKVFGDVISVLAGAYKREQSHEGKKTHYF